MVTSVTSFGRSGVSDWIVQRVTAVVLLAYFLLLGWVVIGGVDYASWKDLFSQTWMRIFSVMAILSLAVHGWIGMWVVLTDYLTERLMGSRGNVLRLTCQVVCGLIVFVYVIWGVQILWSN